MSANLTIEVSAAQADQPVTLFKVKGEVNTNSYELLQARADQEHAAGMRDLVLDLSQVPYVSSAGLRALHHIFMLLRAPTPEESDAAMSKGLRDGTFRSPHLKLLSPSPAVREILKVSGFDMYMQSYDTLEEALASFA